MFTRLYGRYFRLTAPAAVLGHLGAISLKNLTKRKEVMKLEKELIRPIVLVGFHNSWMYRQDQAHPQILVDIFNTYWER